MKLSAIVGVTSGQTRQQTVKRMAETQAIFASQEIHTYSLGGYGEIGCVYAPNEAERFKRVYQGQDGSLIVLLGVPIVHEGSVDRLVGSALAAGSAGPAKLGGLEGAYTALCWVAAEKKFAVVTDILGMHPLYIFHTRDCLAVSTDIRGLAASQLFPIEMDAAGWGQFVSFGHTIGDSTQLRQVARAPRAATIWFDARSGQLESRSTWHWPERLRIETMNKAPIGDLVDALRRDIRAYESVASRSTVLLSGGFDSRLIACLVRERGVEAEGLIVRHMDEYDDIDGRLAARVARRLKMPFRAVVPPASFFSSGGYQKHLVLGEVGVPSLGLFIATLADVITSKMGAVWEGVFPGYSLMAPRQPKGRFDAYLTYACKPEDSPWWKAVDLVFAPSVGQAMREGLRQSIEAEIARYPNDSYGVSRFIVSNRGRHRTSPTPLKVYANFVLPLTPGMNREFWELMSGISLELREEGRLYREVFRRIFPQVAAIPVCTGGKLIGLKPWQDRHFWLDKARRVVGYRNAVRYGLTFRFEQSTLPQEMLATVQPDHPGLNGAAIRRLQVEGVGSKLDQIAVELLFYWQAWRMVMDGRMRVNTGGSIRRNPGMPSTAN